MFILNSCPGCGGDKFSKIEEDVTEVLDVARGSRRPRCIAQGGA
jgi:transposase